MQIGPNLFIKLLARLTRNPSPGLPVASKPAREQLRILSSKSAHEQLRILSSESVSTPWSSVLTDLANEKFPDLKQIRFCRNFANEVPSSMKWQHGEIQVELGFDIRSQPFKLRTLCLKKPRLVPLRDFSEEQEPRAFLTIYGLEDSSLDKLYPNLRQSLYKLLKGKVA